MDKPSRVTEIADKVISYAGYILLTAFIAIFSVIGLLAVILLFSDGDLFNLVGIGSSALIVWALWSVRSTLT